MDLASAFTRFVDKHPSAKVWVVGPDEADYFQQIQAILGKAMSQVKRVGFTLNPERFTKPPIYFVFQVAEKASVI